MIVFKKIKFKESEEVIEKKIKSYFVKDGFYSGEDPIHERLSKLFEEITEYTCEIVEKEYFLLVTRKELWDDFTKALNDSGVVYNDEDIQDSFFQGEIDNEIFQTTANLYMLKHMTVDEVLDKMNKYGKKYLTDIDYEILKKAKNLS